MPIFKQLAVVFISLFTCSYCRAQILIGDIHQPISKSELASFKNFIGTSQQPELDNNGNNFVYGRCGTNTEALGALYERTKDKELLDLMIQYADHMLKKRNDPVTGRTVWTGKKELCWPNRPATSPDSLYAGTENGDIVGHIAYCAKLIIQNKAIWNNKVTTGDPNNYGDTYIKRAKTYINECDKTIQTFILPYFVKSDTHQFIFPSSTKYGINDRATKSLGLTIPWNQQAMQANGFQRLAECFELLGTEPAKVKLYDDIVDTYTKFFISSLTKYQLNGHDVYKWSYSSYDPVLKYVEDIPHGGYDMQGIYRAYQRSKNKYHIPAEVMQNLSNTIYYVICKSKNTFAAQVNGNISDVKKARGYLAGSWLYFAEWNAPLYDIIAQAGLPRTKNEASIASAILCYKDKLYSKP